MSRGKKLHLQGLRGIAIIAVLLVHFYPKQFPNGYLGVDLFFVLSGFLMCMMLSKSSINTEFIMDFLFRRIKRILPLYFLFILLTLLSFPYFFRPEYLSKTTTNGLNAVLLITNIEEIQHSSVYEIEMQMGVNVFLHTWSLCVELQYYLLYPLIHILILKYSYMSTLIVCLSFFYYLSVAPIVAFNSVWSRIWQFLSGAIAFSLQNNKLSTNSELEKQDEESLIANETSDSDKLEGEVKESKKDVYLVNMSLFLLQFTILSPVAYSANYTRLVTTGLAWIIVVFGESNCFLSISPLVWLGEISYALYLVHWPIVSYIRITDQSDEVIHFIGIITSLVFASVLYVGFERYYLKWNKKVSFAIISVLFISCLTSLQVLTRLQIGTETAIPEISYENLSTEQLIELNNDNQAKDVERLLVRGCKSWSSFCNIQNTTFSGKTRLLVLGNSWGGNAVQTVVDQCKSQTSNISIQFIKGCEVLVRLDNPGFHCEKYEKYFFEAIETVKPDVLFIIEKHISLANKPKSVPDEMLAQMKERMERIMKFVSRKIYILGSFPRVSRSVLKASNQHILKKLKVDSKKFLDVSIVKTVDGRLSKLLKYCNKCEIFDYKPYFPGNGTIELFDPKTQLSYFNSVEHLTPLGKKFLVPAYRDLCSKLS